MLGRIQPSLALGFMILAGSLSLLLLGCEKPSKGGSIVDLPLGHKFQVKLQSRVDSDTGERLPFTKSDLESISSTMADRLDHLGITDYTILITGEDELGISAGGEEGLDEPMVLQVKERLGQNLTLSLHLVHPDKRLAESVFKGNEQLNDYVAYEYQGKTRRGELYVEYLLLRDEPIITAADIADCWPQTQGFDTQVGIKLTKEGGNAMSEATSKLDLGVDRVAIVLGGEILTAPTVNDRLRSNFVIMGQSSFDEAATLANLLLTPLAHPVTITEIKPTSEATQ